MVHPWSTTHEPFTDAERYAAGGTEDLIRLSVGIEHIDDLKEDFRQALVGISNSVASKPEASEARVAVQRKINQALYGEAPLSSQL